MVRSNFKPKVWYVDTVYA